MPASSSYAPGGRPLQPRRCRTAQRAREQSLRQRNETLLADNRRLRAENQALREELAIRYGRLGAATSAGPRRSSRRLAGPAQDVLNLASQTVDRLGELGHRLQRTVLVTAPREPIHLV